GAEIYGQQRIKPGTYSGSPGLADGKIYVTNEDGVTTVVLAGPKFEVVAENALNDYCLSSPAISDGQIFIRTAQNLYCIGNRATGQSLRRICEHSITSETGVGSKRMPAFNVAVTEPLAVASGCQTQP